MKKIGNKGFVLAETLVVTVFLMTIFSMIYYYFYPLIGEYEKREVYDDVDGKYSVYWLKRIIEDSGYTIDDSTDSGKAKKANFQKYGYFRFECKDVTETDEKRQMCQTLVNALQVEGCTSKGNMCNIFITAYKIGDGLNTNSGPYFKRYVTSNLVRYNEDCLSDNDAICKSNFKTRCQSEKFYDDNKCDSIGESKVFSGGFQDYVELLPDYKTPSRNGADYRIIVIFKHRADNNNYYSFATMEVG